MNQELLLKVKQHAVKTAELQTTMALVEWDQQTGMPSAASPYRARQMAHLSGLIHQLETDARFGESLATLASEVEQEESIDGATILQLKRNFDKKVKLPQRLVEELAAACSAGQHAWAGSPTTR